MKVKNEFKRVVTIMLSVFVLITTMAVPTYAVDYSGKQFTIAHASGNVITCSGTENGANVTSSKPKNSTLQTFEFESSNGYYLIKCVGSEKYIEVRNGSHNEKAVVGQWQNNGQVCALWQIISNSDGTVSFKNAESGLYMNVLANSNDSGTQIIQYSDDGTTAMKFYLNEVGGKNNNSSVSNISTGKKYNIAHTSGNVITSGGSENGANITSSKAKNSNYQTFEFESSNGYYLIKCVGSEKYIEVRDGKHEEKAVVGQWENAGQKCALWTIISNSDGTVSFKNAESGLYMNVLANSNDSGTQIIQYKNDGTTAMKFYLNEVSVKSDNSASVTVSTSTTVSTGKSYNIAHISGNVITSSGNENGANVTSSKQKNSNLQAFEFESSNGYYLIKCVGSGKYIEVRDGQHEERAVVGQWENAGQKCALWTIISNSDGTYSFKNAESGLYMNVLGNSNDSGTQIVQYKNDGTTAMKFYLTEVGGKNDNNYSTTISTGKSYNIAHTSGNVITSSGNENGANVTSSKQKNSNLQAFEFESSNGYYLIKCVGSGKYIEVRDSKHEERAVVGQWENAGQKCALWTIISNSDGTYSFKNAESGLYMNVLGNSNDSGTQIVQYKNDGTTAMKFYLNDAGSAVVSSKGSASYLVETARAEIGERERSAGSDDIKYNDWYYGHSVYNTKSGQYAWCAAFVSWCANEAGLSGIIPSNAGCTAMKDAIIEEGGTLHLRSSGYTPQYGDIIFFGSNAWQHIGIVDYSDGTYVYYIDGNNTSTSPHSVCYSTKELSDSRIWGYVTPNYENS